MTKKITAIFLALCMAISVLPMTIQAASKPDIKVGDYVKMGTYNNASIPVSYTHLTLPTNSLV